jgi:hypothetical protein
MAEGNYEFDAALSFAGADREIARAIAGAAAANGLRVFFDEQHVWESWGKNLNEYLGEIYDRKSRFCVVLISREYCEKSYTNLERRRALDRALESKVEYILPVRLDDSWLEGLPRATAYFDLRKDGLAAVAEALVRKVKGGDAQVTLPEGLGAARGVVVDGVGLEKRGGGERILQFVDIRIAPECTAWKDPALTDEGEVLEFTGGVGFYEDPIFDITVMNVSGDAVVLTAVGIEVLGASCDRILMLGGGGAAPLELHRTYQLDLPDVWRALAEKGSRAMEERARCRLPDPIVIDSRRAYRFGLHLFDYTNCCPTGVTMKFWARTDRGDVRSSKAELSYTIGGDIPPLVRFRKMLAGEEWRTLTQDDLKWGVRRRGGVGNLSQIRAS